jgi:hypothetical protein
MRAIILNVAIFISISAFSQQAPFLVNLGRGAEQNIECSCSDNDKNLVVSYYDFKTQELVFDKWDLSSKLWKRGIARVPSIIGSTRNTNKCLYKSDTLFVITGNKDDGTLRPTLYYYLNGKAVKLANFLSSRGDAYVSDIKILKNNLVFFGLFEYISSTVNSEKFAISNVAIFNHSKWLSVGTNQVLKNAIFANLPLATNGDTMYIIANDNLTILRYYFPEKMETIIKSENKIPYSSVTFFNDRCLITKLNSDSLYFYKNQKLIRFKVGKVLSGQVNVETNSKDFIIAEDYKINSLYLLDTAKKAISLIYQQPNANTGILPKSNLVKVQTSLFYSFNIPIIFKDKRLDYLAELNFDFDRTYKTTVISIFLFDDTNQNNLLDGGETLLKGTVRNKTYGYNIVSNTGKFEDVIPNLSDVEYELLLNSLSECLRPSFTGSIKTNIGSGKNDIYFPLQRYKTSKNLVLKSYAKAKARMYDTIPLTIRIFKKDCDLQKTNAQITLTLDSNTLFINSVPNYTSKKGNQYQFNLLNLNPNVDSNVTVNVVYSGTYYKLDQYVSHYIQMSTSALEDTIDNADSIVQKMTYSYDPNAKYSIPQGKIISDLKYIRYYIEFQNEGNDYARRVTIVDSLDTRIPVYEFQMVGSSHSYTVSIKDNVITWTFDNINLPPKSLNDKGSQGFVVFDAHVISNFGVGDSIHNKAYIYFDYNLPIITNLAIIERIEDLPVIEEVNYSFRVFPNPANAEVTIENKIDVLQTIKVFNIHGQEVLDMSLDPIGKTEQSIANWPRGMYFIKSNSGDIQKFLVH